MKKDFEFPSKIPIFPLSNFIIFPNTNVPLNIFEPRYIDMVDDSMKSNKFIGMVQPKNNKENETQNPETRGSLHPHFENGPKAIFTQPKIRESEEKKESASHHSQLLVSRT